MMCLVGDKEYTKEEIETIERAVREAWEIIKYMISDLYNKIETIINTIVEDVNEHMDDYTDDELGKLARLVGLKQGLI